MICEDMCHMDISLRLHGHELDNIGHSIHYIVDRFTHISISDAKIMLENYWAASLYKA